MKFFLITSGIFSSLILFAAGIQITSINIDFDSVPEQQVHEEALFNHIGTAFIGLGCFTGPLLIGIASLIQPEKQQEPKSHLASTSRDSRNSEQVIDVTSVSKDSTVSEQVIGENQLFPQTQSE